MKRERERERERETGGSGRNKCKRVKAAYTVGRSAVDERGRYKLCLLMTRVKTCFLKKKNPR